MSRLTEGKYTSTDTYLGVRGFSTGTAETKSFALEHSFYGAVNSSFNFFRGGENNVGTNLYGQARMITVAGNAQSGNATCKLILGTRRLSSPLISNFPFTAFLVPMLIKSTIDIENQFIE